MSKMWEVDPETKSKLLDIQKENDNMKCVDCGAPSPQWASPKFGIFMCLSCSGIHCGLGVHISFIRSITMDAFKGAELARMSNGGNAPWKAFFDAHPSNKATATSFDASTIQERYDSEAGEEWKERLTAKIEGRQYTPPSADEKQKAAAIRARSLQKQQDAALSGSRGGSQPGSRSGTPLARGAGGPMRTASPGGKAALGTGAMQGGGGGGGAMGGRKAQNEAYFARMGAANEGRPEGVAPSQGGKYAGFGSEPMPQRQGGNPQFEDISKDAVAALTKGFGWLSTTVTKGAQDLNEGWVKPGMQKLQEGDIARQAQETAFSLGTNAQKTFNRFVEGPQGGAAHSKGAPEKADFWESFGQEPKGPANDKKDFWDSFGEAPKSPPADKKDFWDEFSAAGDARTQAAAGTAQKKSGGSIGTSAMKKTSGGAAGKDDNWGEW